jgi:hypothetical protein
MIRTSINSTTMLGNSRTKPSGIEMEELPFNRIRRRKNDNLDVDFGPFSSIDGAGVVYGMFLTKRWTKPEPLEYFPLMASGRGVYRTSVWEDYQQVVMSSDDSAR